MALLNIKKLFLKNYVSFTASQIGK